MNLEWGPPKISGSWEVHRFKNNTPMACISKFENGTDLLVHWSCNGVGFGITPSVAEAKEIITAKLIAQRMVS